VVIKGRNANQHFVMLVGVRLIVDAKPVLSHHRGGSRGERNSKREGRSL